MKYSRENESVMEHLENVSRDCGRMCAKFGMEAFGRIIGMFHDAYKDTDKWQEYLSKNLEWGKNGRNGNPPALVTHAPESALYLAWRLAMAIPNTPLAQAMSELMAQCILSHHSGLHNVQDVGGKSFIKAIDGIYAGSPASNIAELNRRTGDDFSTIDGSMFDSVLDDATIKEAQTEYFALANSGNGELFVRMMFSALVDADRLDAERHGENSAQKGELRGGYDQLPVLLCMLDKHFEKMASSPSASLPINIERTKTRLLVDQMASGVRSVYNLVLPTGVGKTLTGISFALRHAIQHGMDRVIVLAPFTTVVDQTANEYTGIFGDRNVVEHQCDFDALDKVDKETGEIKKGYRSDLDELEDRMGLIVENWDIPIVVTTTVQFFESLLQGKAGSTRKIHNIANSVIIIDEEQQLPTFQLYPVLNVLNALVKDFGCTVIRSTATLPAFDGDIDVGNGDTVHGYDSTTNLVGNLNTLFRMFKRADVRFIGKVLSDDIAHRISSMDKSFLCVVNTRKKCRELYDEVAKPDHMKYMLSKNICPRDRKRLIEEIRKRLANGDKITVVSTSLVEAGVDFDFEEAYRECNSLYSIFQTRGRCNRNGRMSNGMLYVFEMSDKPIRSYEDAYQKAETTRNILVNGQLPMNMSEHDICIMYSRHALYKDGDKVKASEEGYRNCIYSTKGERLSNAREKERLFNYRSFGDEFCMIKEHRGFPVVVRFHADANDHEIDDLIAESKWRFDKKTQRKFQQYVVEVCKNDAQSLYNNGMVDELVCRGKSTGLYVLNEKNFNGGDAYINGTGISVESLQMQLLDF